MELYVIRHGTTYWNALRRFQGATDIELNEDGKALALKCGDRLKDIHFDRVFASPLTRAYTTAELILQDRDIAIEKDDRLREISFGIMEGCNYDQWLQGDKPYKYFFTEPEKYLPPEKGDTIQSLCDRTKAFLTEVVEPLYGSCERVMIVAHGGANAAMRCYLEDHGIEEFWGCGVQPNCEEIIFHYDGNQWSR